LLPRGQDTPECCKGLGQDVSSAAEIRIACVIARDTAKHLSLTVAPIVLTTSGTCSGGASRIDGDRQNAVFRRQTFDPLADATAVVAEWSAFAGHARAKSPRSSRTPWGLRAVPSYRLSRWVEARCPIQRSRLVRGLRPHIRSVQPNKVRVPSPPRVPLWDHVQDGSYFIPAPSVPCLGPHSSLYFLIDAT